MPAEPFILAVAPMPYKLASTSPTVAELLDHPKAARTTIGASTGQDKETISSATTVAAILGKSLCRLNGSSLRAKPQESLLSKMTNLHGLF